MIIGYARVSKSDGSQALDLQRDALIDAGVDADRIYTDMASGAREDRPGLESCLKSLREGDTLIVWKLDRLGRSLHHLVNTVQDLDDRGIAFKVLAGKGATINTSTPSGKLVFGIAEFERELISERRKAGLQSARARGRNGGRKPKMTKAKIKLAQAAMRDPATKVSELCKELGISRQTLYRYIGPDGENRN